MNIAHPFLTNEENKYIETQLKQDEAIALEVLENIYLRKRFLSATKISNILKSIPLDSMTVYFNYIYDSNNNEDPFNYQGIEIHIGQFENKLHGEFNNNLTMEFLNFLDNMEKSFFNAKDYRFTIGNNEKSIKNFLKKLLSDEYELWQNLYLDQKLSEKTNNKKSLKI